MRSTILSVLLTVCVTAIGCGEGGKADIGEDASGTGDRPVAGKNDNAAPVTPSRENLSTQGSENKIQRESEPRQETEAPEALSHRDAPSPNTPINPFKFDTPVAELQEGQAPPLLGEIDCINPANDFAISWDGQFLARVGFVYADMVIWRIANGEIVKKLTPHDHNLISVTFSPDGKNLFASHESINEANISVWDLETGKLAKTNMGHERVTWHIACLPDGKTLASYGAWNTTIRLWDISSEEKIAEFAAGGPTRGWFTISPDGSRIAAPAANGHVALINVTDQSLLENVNIGKASPRGVDMFETQLAVAGGPSEGLVIYDLSDEEATHRAPLGKYVRFARFSHDGKLIAAVKEDFGDSTIHIFSAKSGQKLFQFKCDDDNQVDQIRFHPAAPVLATAAGRKIRFWDLRRLAMD